MQEPKEKRAVSLMISTNAMAIAFDHAQESVRGFFPFDMLRMEGHNEPEISSQKISR